jgi:hypothetical protein
MVALLLRGEGDGDVFHWRGSPEQLVALDVA